MPANPENIIATLQEPFVVLDKCLRVRTANTAFYRDFHTVTPSHRHTVTPSHRHTVTPSAGLAGQRDQWADAPAAEV